MVIYLLHILLCVLSHLNQEDERASYPSWNYKMLLQMGFTLTKYVTIFAVSSYLAFSSLLLVKAFSLNKKRLFSVALSLEFPPLDVIQHHLLLWSPDFPRTLPHGLAIRDHSIYSFYIVL